MNYIFYKGWKTVPSEWNELTAKQAISVFKAMVQYSAPAQLETLQVALLCRLLCWPSWRLALTMRLHKFWNLGIAAKNGRVHHKALNHLDRASKLGEASTTLTQFLFEKNTLTRNLLRHYRGLWGPANNGSDLTMAEFVYSEKYFIDYQTTKNVADLNLLVSVLYRQGKGYNRHTRVAARVKFQPPEQRHIAAIERWPIWQKILVYKWYDAVREEKIAQHPKPFEASEDTDTDPLMYGLWSVMRNVAKAGHFGDFDKVQEQYVDTILMELTEAITEAEKLEAAQPTTTPEPTE
jgi:hypothetical protein